jgi:hypothetical protein
VALQYVIFTRLCLAASDKSLPKAGGELKEPKAPKAIAEQALKKANLAVFADKSTVLQFSETWSMAAIDEWLRDQFVNMFIWLDARYGRPERGKYHWALLGKEYSQLYVVDCVGDITGADLASVKGTAGRSAKDCAIRIGEIHLTRNGTALTLRSHQSLTSNPKTHPSFCLRKLGTCYQTCDGWGARQ